MEMMRRYAVYYAPPAGAFADLAGAWLGWDAATGQELDQPALGLPAAGITREPRKYGFHGTIKPPFRLAPGCDYDGLSRALAGFAATRTQVVLPGLRMQNLDGFLALVPEGDPAALQSLAGDCVRALDPFRAAPGADEIARRQPERLSPRQRALLDEWGYPFVMEEFRFHLTLTGRLPPHEAEEAAAILRGHFAPVLPRPFVIGDLCLFGEARDGRFHILHRYALSG